MNFPSSPTLGQQYTFNSRTWEWNGSGWAMVPASVPAEGSDTEVQFNDGGARAGDPDFTWNKTTGKLRVNNYIGVGVTPSAWGTYYAAQVGQSGAFTSGAAVNSVEVISNAYFNGTNWKYIYTDVASLYQQYAGAHVFYGAPSGTAGNNISLTTLLGISKGNSVYLEGASPQAGTGITFPAAVNLCSDGNTLDDYEEGTWTPTLTGDGGSGVTYSVNSGSYVKVGKLVTVWAQINLTSKGTMSGNCYLAGLPFTLTATGTDCRAGGFVEYGAAFGGCFVFATGEGGTSAYFIYSGTALLGWSTLTNTSSAWFTYTFSTDQ